ncbi:MAG: class I SAM-dependent methyltransferase [Filomicrobium sp.]|nr:class I SAM-dependent methyltransferase [Filomicrobium sp.]
MSATAQRCTDPITHDVRCFARAWPEVKALGFDERFRRLWNYYLVYCEAGFEAGWLDVGLYQLRHSGRTN